MSEEFSADQTFHGRIHDRVEHWLHQEGWTTEPLTSQSALWALVATDRNGRRLVISQSRTHEDRVLIEGRVVPSAEQANRLEALLETERESFVWDTRIELLRLGIDYSGVESPLKRVVLVESIYFEGALDSVLAKDTFFQRIEQIRRGVAMVQLLIRRRLGA